MLHNAKPKIRPLKIRNFPYTPIFVIGALKEQRWGIKGPTHRDVGTSPPVAHYFTLNRVSGQPYPRGLYTCFIHKRTHSPTEGFTLTSQKLKISVAFTHAMFFELLLESLTVFESRNLNFYYKEMFEFLWELLQRPDDSSAKQNTDQEGDSVSNIPPN